MGTLGTILQGIFAFFILILPFLLGYIMVKLRWKLFWDGVRAYDEPHTPLMWGKSHIVIKEWKSENDSQEK